MLLDGNRKREAAVKCPECNQDSEKVIRTSKSPDSISRIRQCLNCGHLTKTMEVQIPDNVSVPTASDLLCGSLERYSSLGDV